MVDRATIKFWNLLAKFQTTQASNFLFINILKIVGCATNQDVLLLATLQYLSRCKEEQIPTVPIYFDGPACNKQNGCSKEERKSVC